MAKAKEDAVDVVDGGDRLVGRRRRREVGNLQPFLQLPCCQNLQTVIAHPLQAQEATGGKTMAG